MMALLCKSHTYSVYENIFVSDEIKETGVITASYVTYICSNAGFDAGKLFFVFKTATDNKLSSYEY